MILRSAIARVAASPRLVGLLALVDLTVVAVAAQPLSAALAYDLDRRPAALHLVSGDDASLVELVQDRPELLQLALRSAELALLVHLVLGSIVAGGLVAVLVGDDRRGLWVACREHALRMIGLGLFAWLGRALALAGLGLSVNALWPHHLDAAIALLALDIAGTSALSAVLLAYARALAVERPARPLARCLVGAFVVAARNRRASLLFLAWTAATAFGVLVAQELLAWGLSISIGGVAVSLFAAALLALVRAALDAVLLVAAGRVAVERYSSVVPIVTSTA
jgi:hypothetical protein